MNTVLVTGAGTATCQGVLKALRTQNELPVRLLVVDPDANVAGRYLADSFEQVPLANDPGFVDCLIGLSREHSVDLVIPIVDMEFLPIANRGAEFPCALSLSSTETLVNCLEKDRTYHVLDELGIRHPKVYPANDQSDTSFPKFVKPRIGRASLDTYRVDSAEELRIALDHVKDPLVSEFIEGVEMTIDTLCDLQGKWIGGCVRVREMTKSGVSTKGLVVYSGTVLGEARRIVERLGVRGPACLQCFNTPEGPIWFEVNPRFGGGSILSVAAGFNSPLYLLQCALGMPVSPYKPTEVVRMVRYWQEVFLDGRGREVGRGSEVVRSAN